MVNNFETINHINGNISVKFMENGKRRSIIFLKGSYALETFEAISETYEYNTMRRKNIYGDFNTNTQRLSDLADSCDELMKKIINDMKKYFVFKKNENNVSIFYPVELN